MPYFVEETLSYGGTVVIFLLLGSDLFIFPIFTVGTISSFIQKIELIQSY